MDRSRLVSCIVPTYKRSDSLIRAINSILKQTHKNLEVIVVDDNNPNDEYSLDVQEKLKKIDDSRVRYVQQDKHINGAAARNVGIRVSKGEYIAFLDDDDEWLPNKIELQVREIENNKDCEGVTCLYTIYNNGKPIRKATPYTAENLHKKVLERSVAVFTSTVLFKKHSLIKSGCFDESMIRHQDLQLLLDFLIDNKLSVLTDYQVLLHTEVGGNRPNSEKFIEIKEHFFLKMKRHFQLYDKKTQKRMYAVHYFEIILLLLREKRIKKTIYYVIKKIGFNPRAYLDLYSRYMDRKRNSF